MDTQLQLQYQVECLHSYFNSLDNDKDPRVEFKTKDLNFIFQYFIRLTIVLIRKDCISNSTTTAYTMNHELDNRCVQIPIVPHLMKKTAQKCKMSQHNMQVLILLNCITIRVQLF